MRRFVENYVSILSAEFVQGLSAAVIAVWVSRQLGVEEAGIYFLAATFATLFGRVSYWGLDELLTREVAKKPERGNQFTLNFLVLRAALALLMLLVLYGVVTWFGYSAHTSRVILLVGLTILPDSLINIGQSVFMAYERMGYIAVTSLLNGVVRVVAGVLALVLGFGLEGVAVGLLLASVSTLVVLLYLIQARLFQPAWDVDLSFCRRQLSAATPFLLIGIFFILESQLDIVLLSRLGNEYQVGLYGVASTVVGALILIPLAFRRAVFPVMSRLYATAPNTLGRLYDQSFKYLFLAGLPMAVGVLILAPDIVTLVFGEQFLPSAPVLQILAGSLLLIFMYVPSARLLIVADHQRIMSVFLLISLAVNVVFNLLLIPSWGAIGSAVARSVSTFVLFVVLTGFVFRQVYRSNPLPLMVRPAIAVTVMAASVYVLQDWSIFVLIPMGAAVYFAGLVALRTFSREDLMLWRQIAVRQPAESEA